MFRAPETFRVTTGRFATTKADGVNGFFRVPITENGRERVATVIASDGDGWEHVSVSFKDRAPSWAAMCKVKALFWGEDDCVMQYHPPKSDYVNFHPYCLHLWRPVGVEVPRPPSYLVGGL